MMFETSLYSLWLECPVAGWIRSGCAKKRASILQLLEILMDELDRHRAFADRRGDTLDRTGPHVSGGEYAGPTGLQEVRMSCAVEELRQVGACPHKALLVSFDLRWNPIGAGHGADETEYG